MITNLALENFRCFRSFSLPIQKKTVFLTGSNGQGKTSVLEAVFFLANLRSFRTLRTSEMILDGESSFRIRAGVQLSSFTEQYEILCGEKRILRIGGRNISKSSEFAGVFRTVVFLPDDPVILTGPSQVRRRFFDMFISMMDREYFRNLQRYSSALKSRNALLRSGKTAPSVMEAWDDVLACCGVSVVRSRERYAALLCDFMRGILLEIRPELSHFQIRMRTGKDSADQEMYRKKLFSLFERDSKAGFTSYGPHADDFEFTVDGKPLRIYGSRGQCRMVSFVMKMAELDIVNSGSGESVVLVDDAVGDLDRRARKAFFEKIGKASQVFHASTEPYDDFPFSDVQFVPISFSSTGDCHV